MTKWFKISVCCPVGLWEGGFGVLWPDSDELHQWTMSNYLWSVDYSRSLSVFESDANVIWIKLSQIAGALRKGLRSTKYNQTACLSIRCYQMLVQCCKYVTNRRNAEKGEGICSWCSWKYLFLSGCPFGMIFLWWKIISAVSLWVLIMCFGIFLFSTSF